MTASEQFKNYRKGNRVRQSTLIEKTGINRTTIWRFENGKDMNVGTLEKLLEAMDAKIIIVHKDV